MHDTATPCGGQTAALSRYMVLSVSAALLVLLLKLGAWWLTGSVGLLSDALESVTNVAGAVMGLLMVRLAALPPDEDHAYGHGKAEYFASGFEGMLIFLAAVLILFEAVPRFTSPQAVQQPLIGLVVAIVATGINFAVARVLLKAGQQRQSPALVADARHLMADVWTTLGVVLGVALVALTGRLWLDPLVALLVALNVLWEGYRLGRSAVGGLMDPAWPDTEQRVLQETLQQFKGQGVDFHAVRTRTSAAQRFVSFHVLVPGSWSVQRAHDLLETIEQSLIERLPNLSVFTHAEPAEDPKSYDDDELHAKRHF